VGDGEAVADEVALGTGGERAGVSVGSTGTPQAIVPARNTANTIQITAQYCFPLLMALLYSLTG
jgi:hypothetical protein